MTRSISTDPLAASAISMGQIMSVLRRRWWIVLLLPIVAVLTTYLFQRSEPFQSTIRATVLIPGDTEIPGNSERPELMVLDDIPPFLRSYAFAEQVREAMPGTQLSIEQVRATLDGSRYSRVVTVSVTDPDTRQVEAIANAAASVLPDAINAYLMPADGQQATVRVIDPPSPPTRDRSGHRLQLLLTAGLGLLIGSLIAIAIGSREGVARQPETESK